MSLIGGSYRINQTDFPAPATTWEERPIAQGLNGISVNSAYKQHRWRWKMLGGETVINLFALFDNQQSGVTPITSIETDPYDASGANLNYGTVEYTDVVMVSMSSRTRGLPHYEDLEIVFEVYVA